MMIELEQVGKSYQMGDIIVPALKSVSLGIEPGEFIAIMGSSGSGKSTLLHILGLLDKPDTGSYRFMDQQITDLDDSALAHLRSETIGFVFQQFHLLRRTTALDNVALPLVYRSGSKMTADPRQLLEQVGLGKRLEHKPNELSGGQQQRVAIARALVNQPKLLMADEPTGNLDSASSHEIMSLFQELNRKGITVILVTHEPDIAKYAGRIIRMQDGLIQSDEKRCTTVDASLAHTFSQQIISPSSKTLLIKKNLKIFTYFQQAARALLANKLRTTLSALGIIIGVAAVITMLALGKGAQASISQQLSGLGSNRLVVRPNSQNIGGVRQQAGSTSRLTFKQVEDIRESISQAKTISPAVRSRGQVVWSNQNASTDVIGTMPDYMQIYAAVPLYGRFFTQEENQSRQRVALLGLTVVKNIFDNQNPIGEWIKINRVSFQVIGVLPVKGATGPQDADDVIVIPLYTAMYRVMGKNYIDYIDVAAESPEAVEAVQRQILKLSQNWPTLPNATGESYRVDNLASVQEAFNSIARMLGLLLASIATISLIVGGIGIMNIMLVSVTERTREIGLRKAIGASSSDIMNQFLIESIVLCLAGGICGIILGGICVLITGKLTGWVLGISPFSILISCGFSALVGIGFGLWPAKKAAGLNPIEALRYE